MRRWESTEQPGRLFLILFPICACAFAAQLCGLGIPASQRTSLHHPLALWLLFYQCGEALECGAREQRGKGVYSLCAELRLVVSKCFLLLDVPLLKAQRRNTLL